MAEARRSCSGRRSARSTYSHDMIFCMIFGDIAGSPAMGGVPPMAKLGACPVVVVVLRVVMVAAAAPEAVSVGRLKVACAEKVGRPRAEMSGGGGSRPSLGE